MATVTNTIKLPDGTAPDHAAVEIELVASASGHAAGWITATDVTVLSTARPTVAAGAWSAALTPNADIDPAGTVYRVTEHVGRNRYENYIEVDSDGGTVHDLLVDPPASVASAALGLHLIDPTDAHDAAAVSFTAAGDHLETDVQAALEQTPTGRVIPDLVWSWWTQPQCVYNERRQRIYKSGISRGGAAGVGWFDLRHNQIRTPVPLFLREVDDHNGPAILFEDGLAPLVASNDHGTTEPDYRLGFAPHEIEAFAASQDLDWTANTTYGWLIRRPTTSTVLFACRGGSGGTGWYYRISTDWGATWGTETRWFGYQYPVHRITGSGASTVMRIAMQNNNSDNSSNTIKAFQINTSTGAVSNSAGTGLSGNYNLWAQSTVISSSDLETVRTVSGTDRVRLLSVGPSGSVLAAEWTAEENEGVYWVYRHNGSGTFTAEQIVATGLPLGYYDSEGGSNYYGGGVFGEDDSTLYLCLEDDGTWTLERWERSGAGVWASAGTLLTRTDGRKLGRPQIPVGAEALGWVVVGDYHEYVDDNYDQYYADAVLVRWED
jgi:hypothetical protein